MVASKICATVVITNAGGTDKPRLCMWAIDQALPPMSSRSGCALPSRAKCTDRKFARKISSLTSRAVAVRACLKPALRPAVHIRSTGRTVTNRLAGLGVAANASEKNSGVYLVTNDGGNGFFDADHAPAVLRDRMSGAIDLASLGYTQLGHQFVNLPETGRPNGMPL